jgi:NHL repeat
MPFHRLKRCAARTAFPIAAAFCLFACGGGGGGGSAEPGPVAPPRTFTNFQAASFAIGQPDLVSVRPDQGQERSASGLHGPHGLAMTPAGGILVADHRNNRVLFHPSMPATSGAAAGAVLGQDGFGSSAPAVSRNGFDGPVSIAVGFGKMAVADFQSHRVLIYDRIPAPGEAMPEPVSVIGQPDFESSGLSCGPGGLGYPLGVFISPDGKLLVADSSNSRLLVWDAIPEAGTFAPTPNLVLGQSDLDHCAFRDHDQDGQPDLVGETTDIVTHATYRSMVPGAVWTDGKRLAVVDTGENRVLIWNTFPTANFQPAELVLGHSDFANTDYNDAPAVAGAITKPSSSSLREPRGIHSDGISLVVADTFNHRVLIWNTFPQANNQPADVVLGQPAFDRYATEDQNGDLNPDPPAVPDARMLNRPTNVLLTGEALFVTDLGQNRVLVFRKP